MFRGFAIAAALACLASAAAASGPVPKTYEGCVVRGAYVVGPYVIQLFTRSGQRLDVARYEGMRLWMRGNLLPSDRFYVEEGPRLLGPCR